MESNPEVDAISKFCERKLKNAASIIEGNMVTSPLAAYLLLSMTVYSADGNTESEIREVLHLSIKDNELQSLQGFQTLILIL